jgi:hypothetical protein
VDIYLDLRSAWSGVPMCSEAETKALRYVAQLAADAGEAAAG